MHRVPAFPAAGFLLAAALAADGPTFDAATVKLSSPDAAMPYGMKGGPGTGDPARFREHHVPMAGLLARAFGVPRDQLAGPRSVTGFPPENYYEVEATMPPDTTQEQFQAMLQNLLAERFHMTVHRETRSYPGYVLTIDKGGPKFHEIAADPNPVTDRLAVVDAPRGDDGFPVIAGPRTLSVERPGGEATRFQEETMAGFAATLGHRIGVSLGRPASGGYAQPRVSDETGLPGKYTFVLEYATSSTSDLPDLFTAVRKQLGLRLEKGADVQVEVVVIDRIDKLVR